MRMLQKLMNVFNSESENNKYVNLTPHKLTVFIVEDNELDSMYLDYKLRETLANYNLVTFKSGEECLNNLHLNPDLVILDYFLTGDNGLSILKKIKEFDEEIPVILISHQKDLDIVIKAFHEGAHDYIIKGNDISGQLRDVVLRLCA